MMNACQLIGNGIQFPRRKKMDCRSSARIVAGKKKKNLDDGMVHEE